MSVIDLRERVFKGSRPLDRLDFVAPWGAQLRLRVKTILQDLSSAITVASWVPKGVVILGMSAKAITEVGCDGGDRTTFSISDGTATWLSKAMSSQKVAAGTALEMGTDIGAITEAKIRAAAGTLTFAATGGTSGTVNSGKVRVTMWYLDTTAPNA